MKSFISGSTTLLGSSRLNSATPSCAHATLATTATSRGDAPPARRSRRSSPGTTASSSDSYRIVCASAACSSDASSARCTASTFSSPSASRLDSSVTSTRLACE